MNTTNVNQTTHAKGGWFNNQAIGFEKARFFWMVILILVQSCIGAAACMLILEDNAGDGMLIACAAVAMTCNAALIAQGPPKWCLLSFYASVAFSIATIIFYLAK
ncbi:MAG: hypothetical protein JSU07_06140 [Bacteroidetes bacterium]|nr:hypothetical protein [Bacteroidota bacterium]